MKRTHSILLLLSGLASCSVYYDDVYVGSADYMLAERNGPSGLHESYQLKTRSSAGDASLRIVSEYDSQRPFLGFQLVELDGQQAERRGVDPYSGLLVRGVYPRSSAERGGVLAGDVLLSLDGHATVYLVQVSDFEATLRADQVVVAKVLRGRAELELRLTTNLLEERLSDTQDVPLEEPPNNLRPYAGVALRGIPEVWCEKIFGERRQAVVVTSVAVGAPAWLAGVRGGDVIDTVDGEPVPTAAELSRRIAEKGAAHEPMRWGIRRAADQRYEATVQLDDYYNGTSDVWVPLICRFRHGVQRDRWGIGPFGLIVSNSSSYVPDSSVRAVKTTSVFNALLGLIHVETSPDESEVRLLWIIRFDT